MGIPSYYRKLVNTIKGLVVKQAPTAKALYFDFNCLIYYIVKKPGLLPSYPGEEGKETWEAKLIEEIVRYVVRIWEEVGKPETVFLGIDGVVPMAKIRQQRLRRFKSIWLAKEETALGLRSGEPSWDTNCITPGTVFMEKLGSALETLCSKKGWSVSTASEPGEGEHKVMRLLREQESTEPIVIYGLDADLVLLTMLNSKSPAYLMREDQDQPDRYAYLSTDILKQTLNLSTQDQVLEYVAAMSLLGNDFLPHSLTVKIKEDGHDLLISELKELKKTGLSLICDGRYCKEALVLLFEHWASREKDLLFHSIKRKTQMRGRPGPENVLENRPLEWCVEKPLLHQQDRWSEYYTKEWLMCSSTKACSMYLEGLQWVLDYYTGQPINTQWYFPYYVPPLWIHLATYTASLTTLPSAPFDSTAPIEPKEQLAMVLPLESWHLLDKAPSHIRTLPATKPHLWPTKFTFFSAGRLWMWECEPILPLVLARDLRAADVRTKQL
jgi:hypothetical protein